MVEFYLLTFPRFPLRKKEHKSYFGKNQTHDFRTSRCADYLKLSKRLGGNIPVGHKEKNSTWDFIGFSKNGSVIRSQRIRLQNAE